MQAITIGLDIAKHWFQVHGVDAAGKVVVRRRLRRTEMVAFFRTQEPCLVGIEASATAHHWARELIGLRHQVKLMAPAYVNAYVRRNKNDAADAEAICEAVTRPSMRFVPIKDIDQQSVLMMHRARALLIRQRTMLVNALRAHLAEFGVIAPQGLRHVEELVRAIEENRVGLPELAQSILRFVVAQLNDTQAKIRQIEMKLAQWHRNSRLSKLLASVPGAGIMGASAIAATVCDPGLFRSGREFAAWLGMTPRQNSSGGKERWGEPANAATNTSAVYSSRAPSRFSGIRARVRQKKSNGCARCWREGRQRWSPSRSPQDRPHRLGCHGARRSPPS